MTRNEVLGDRVAQIDVTDERPLLWYEKMSTLVVVVIALPYVAMRMGIQRLLANTTTISVGNAGSEANTGQVKENRFGIPDAKVLLLLENLFKGHANVYATESIAALEKITGRPFSEIMSGDLITHKTT